VLNWALEHGHKRLRVVSDSELMVKQMQGKYKVGSPGLLPLWQDARRLAARLERFEMRHTLRGGNQEADRLANEAMDKGMGKTAGAASAVGGVSGAKGSTGAPGRQAAPPAQARPPRLVLEGYVKDGVVHLLGGELPDGVFVKVIRE
jgi:probable phosphoglycerate mutase